MNPLIKSGLFHSKVVLAGVLYTLVYMLVTARGGLPVRGHEWYLAVNLIAICILCGLYFGYDSSSDHQTPFSLFGVKYDPYFFAEVFKGSAITLGSYCVLLFVKEETSLLLLSLVPMATLFFLSLYFYHSYKASKYSKTERRYCIHDEEAE